MITRRQFSAAVAAAPLLLRGQTRALNARIHIDPERIIGPIDPKIYGNFTEHLGRCIEGGIFDEGSPLSDANGYRRDVLEAARNLHVTLLRWPGGNFSSNYNWKDGIGPRDQRPKRLEMAWQTVEDNRFGTHEFLNYAEMLGTEPYVCVNFGTGSWTDAQQWVEYCNLADGTEMAALRKKNGREKPWKVTYWGLGNEMDGPWQMGHRSAEDYGKFALEGAKLMKWTDPSVKLIAAGSSNFATREGWTGWNRTVLEYLKDHTDYIALHSYVGNREDDYLAFAASALDVEDRIRTTEGIIREIVAPGARRRIYIAFDEYNVWYRARGQGKEAGRRILEEIYNLEDALVIATLLNTFVNNAHIVKIANMAQLVNVIAPIFTNEKDLFLQTIYYPLQLFAANAHGTALEVFVDSPTYGTKRFDKVPYLDASASLNNGALVLNVVNRHPDQDIETGIEAQDAQFAGDLEVAVVNGPGLKTANGFGAEKVKAEKSTARASGNKVRYKFPAHSFTQIRGALA
ncbi:MAG: alpha-L-arabinofuranosidase C-terminal domain-containing protein [Bryobacteraceae bacterium]